MLNSCVFHGRLASDPELKKLNDDTPYCKFSLAVNRLSDKECDFIPCIAWRQLAETISMYLHKGKEVIVKGQLRTHSYEDSNRIKRKTFSIELDSFDFITNVIVKAKEEASETIESYEKASF